MGEVTLTVPAEYAEMFRTAVVAEVGADARWVLDTQEELARQLLDDDSAIEIDDVRGSTGALCEVMSVLEQLRELQAGDDLHVRGEASALAHMTETTAREVVAPRLSGETGIAPFDGEAVEKIGGLTGAMGWAAAESARLHELAVAELKAAKASAV